METKETNGVSCFDCKRIFKTGEQAFTFEDHKLCSGCYHHFYFNCSYCNINTHNEEKIVTYQGLYVCKKCYTRYFFLCVSCGVIKRNFDAYSVDGQDYCQNCFNDLDNEEDASIFDRRCRDVDVESTFFTSKQETGKTITSKRIYSAEIECYYPNGKAINKVAKEFHKTVGISSDGSLDDNGVEFQTPRLRGLAGENLIKFMCKTLHENEFTINSTCGLHIHLDGGRSLLSKSIKDQKKEPTLVKNLMLFYLKYGDIILSFLPYSRRDNRYCVPLSTNYTADEIANCKTLDEVEYIWYKVESKSDRDRIKRNKYDDTRYSGVNFHSLLGQNHLEIRFHSGTLNAMKIIYWIALHTAIIDAVCMGYITHDTLQKKNIIRSLSEKTGDFFNYLPNLQTKVKAYFVRRQNQFEESAKGGNGKEEDILTSNEDTETNNSIPNI